jgi:hypothetical protein
MKIILLCIAVAASILVTPASAITVDEVLVIAQKTKQLQEQGNAALQRGDITNACALARQSTLTWYQMDPREIPASVREGFNAMDAGVRAVVAAYFKTCSR